MSRIWIIGVFAAVNPEERLTWDLILRFESATLINKKCLIACPIFKDELELALPPSDVDLRIHYMDYRIHNDGKRMFQELKTAVVSADGREVSLLVGCECYCDISIGDFAKGINARVPNEKNCIEIILGPEKTNELQQHRTTIHTRGWMRMINQFITDEPLNSDSIRIMLGHFDRIVLLDYGITPITDEEILSYYDLLCVPIEIEPVQLNYFKGVLNRLL